MASVFTLEKEQFHRLHLIISSKRELKPPK